MKVLTLKQPWATLIVLGIKRYEFRSWKTNYRGTILIHAGKGVDKDALEKLSYLNIDFPQGKIIGKADIVDCLLIDDQLNSQIISLNSLVYGKKCRDGYAWKLDNIKKISYDKKINGKLGLWNIDLQI